MDLITIQNADATQTKVPMDRCFIVHAWASRSQIRLAGRLESGQSFAAMITGHASPIYVGLAQAEETTQLLNQWKIPFSDNPESNHASPTPPLLESFEGIGLFGFWIDPQQWQSVARQLGQSGIKVYNEAPRLAEDYLTRLHIRGNASLGGAHTVGKRVDMVFQNPAMRPEEGPIIPLHWLAIDIETARDGSIRAVSLVSRGVGQATAGQGDFPVAEVLFRGPVTEDPAIRSFASEAGLLQALLERVQAIDPDLITGWNVIDFDLEMLCKRYAALGIPFLLGRSDEPARIEKRESLRTRSFIPGRQAIDAMQLVRGSGTRFEDQTLDTVARGILGIGKLVSEKGEAKLESLDRLYRESPVEFCHYCLEDSRLVILILEKTGLHMLTQIRAALTGIGLELAWTSIPAFERIYGLELHKRHILPPQKDDQRPVTGAAGGMVLNPQAGLFANVLVLDFRSLYPSIMRTFGVDPLSYQRCLREALPDDIVAPNGARFRRQAGILPALISDYFEARLQAQATGDETAAFVYKILMNSFYGVLGSGGCRYGRSELAGAITSFGRFWLEFSRDWFEVAGYRVLYGDTDSVFVATGLADVAQYQELTDLGNNLAKSLNQDIRDNIRQRFGLESFLTIRAEKVYRRFMIPRMRSVSKSSLDGDANRGRAKGYAGLILEASGPGSVEVKGMEAARSDYTPLARRFQTELLALVFGDNKGLAINAFLDRIAAELRSGALDSELVYRKHLRRNAADYEYSETPPVKAARMLGWTKRRGTVEYLMTSAGAEPLGMVSHPIDYEHYIKHQLLPIWDSVADATGLSDNRRFSRQGEFEW